MTSELNEIFDSLADPARRHAALAHIPVVLAIVGALLALASATLLGRSNAFRLLTFLAMLGLAGTANIAMRSGNEAESNVGLLSDAAQSQLEKHEHIGHNIWIFAGAVSIVAACAFIPNKKSQFATSWITFAGAVFAMGWCTRAAHHGGTLVYTYGVNTGSDAAGQPPTGEFALEEPAPNDPRVAHFKNVVFPILEDRCIGCHSGADADAGLDLSSIRSILDPDRVEPAIIPGDDDAGLILEAISWENDFRMPPPNRAQDNKLSNDQIAAIKQWVADGAVWH